jgi:hypothetical protein
MTRRKIVAWISSAIIVAAPFIAYFGHGQAYDVSPFLPGEAAQQIAAFQRAEGSSAKAVSIDVTPKGLSLEVRRISKMLVYDKFIRFEVPSPDGREVAN